MRRNEKDCFYLVNRMEVKPGNFPPHSCGGQLPGWCFASYVGLCPVAPCGRHTVGQQEVHKHESLGNCH